jgi:hypothetical protein
MSTTRRSTNEVFEDHLALAQAGDVDTDLERNYDPDCVILTTYGIFRGHSGAREAAALLNKQIGRTHYTYRTQMTHGEIAFLEWTADSRKAKVDDGADSFWIKDGKVKVMTIHYTVQEY